jgi:hypothetical protein
MSLLMYMLIQYAHSYCPAILHGWHNHVIMLKQNSEYGTHKSFNASPGAASFVLLVAAQTADRYARTDS